MYTIILYFHALLIFAYITMSVPRIWGGGQEFIFQICEFACREATCCAWFAIRIAMGVQGHAPPRNFFKMVQLGAF